MSSREELEKIRRDLQIAKRHARESGFTLLTAEMNSLLEETEEILKNIVWKEYKATHPDLFEENRKEVK